MCCVPLIESCTFMGCQVDLLKLYIKGKEARCNLNDQVAEVGLNDN